MDITTNSQVLAAELRLLTKIAPAKPTIPVLGNVLFQATDVLRLSATDLEIGLSTSCAALITMKGSLTLPAKKLLELVEQLPNADVRITLDAHHVRVSSGAFKSRLQALPADDFPQLPSVEGDSITLPAAALKSLIEQTRYAISDKSQKFTMDGALLALAGQALACVATDGKRLSLATTARTAGLDVTAILPSKTLDVLLAQEMTGDLEFSKGDRHLFFQLGDRLLISRMIDGQFPNYERIIPRDGDKKAVIDRLLFAALLRRVGQVSEQNSAVFLTLEKGSLLVTSQSAEIGEADEPLAIEYASPLLKICVNWRHVLDFLEVASGQTVTIALKDANSAMLLTDGDNFLNVVILMRI